MVAEQQTGSNMTKQIAIINIISIIGIFVASIIICYENGSLIMA